MSKSYILIYHGEGYLLATYKGCIISYWYRKAPLEGAERLLQLTKDQLAHSEERPLAIFSLIEQNSEMAGAETRIKFSEIRKVLGKNCCGGALVLAGSGLFAATVRTVVSSVQLLERMPYPFKTVKTSDEGAIFLKEHGYPHALQLPAIMRELRALPKN